MAASDDLINFDVIEGQKENIQSLPGGRSARKLAELYSPSPLHKLSTPTPSDTQDVNDCIRGEFEAELDSMSESDDPLDIFDRYVRWTLDAYPSAQATPQSQLHQLLERATKAFIDSAQYKDDPRYLKLWLYYIRFFSKEPREPFVFLARNAIGAGLALFYEEFAAWLEGAGCWSQADEVYKLGLEREARPAQRLARKFAEFEQRLAQQPAAATAPASPALPSVRPALAAKVDPYAAAARAADPQAQRPSRGAGPKSGKPKLAIFSDADADASAPAIPSGGSAGWDTIGSLANRKKENTMEPKPWAGETLQAGGKKQAGPKMPIFRDPSLAKMPPKNHISIEPSSHQAIVNPADGRRQYVFVDLKAVYPTPEEPGTELSFEEIWAANQGWLDVCWEEDGLREQEDSRRNTQSNHSRPEAEVDLLGDKVATKLAIHHDRDAERLDENGQPIREQVKTTKARKKKVMEVNETQIIQAKLDSPSGRKMRKKKQSSEPTMTLHTRAATDDIYDIFNAPLKPAGQNDEVTDNDEFASDGDYTSGGESTCMTRRVSTSAPTSEAGDNLDEAVRHTPRSEAGDDEVYDDDDRSDARSESEWSDFTVRKHVPNLKERGEEEEEVGHEDERPVDEWQEGELQGDEWEGDENNDTRVSGEMEPQPDDDGTVFSDELDPRTCTTFIPTMPEDYVPNPRPYRDPVEMAMNRLPFMTPITERTESSLGGITAAKPEYVDASPSKQESLLETPLDDQILEDEDEDDEDEDLEPVSSPLRDLVDDHRSPIKIPPPSFHKSATKLALSPERPIGTPIGSPMRGLNGQVRSPAQSPTSSPHKAVTTTAASTGTAPAFTTPAPTQKGPIINDVQCNPVDKAVRDEILANVQPPLSSYPGFYDHGSTRSGRSGEVRSYTKAGSRSGGRNGNGDRSSIGKPVVLEFPHVSQKYTLKRELGAGAYAPVFLVENSAPDGDQDGDGDDRLMGLSADTGTAGSKRAPLEALKLERPPTAWEFHMMRLAATRLGPHDRATASISAAHELHLYQDEGFLFLPFHSHGTLLDVVNSFREQPTGVMDEPLAMFFAIELMRTVEALHGQQVLHGDLKVDNCLLRLDGALADRDRVLDASSQWQADGSHGWADWGVVLIDFGRAIDMRAFRDDVQFVADWKTEAQDCAEMREGRPWTWQIDYHGLAGIIHCLLFGKYIDAVRCDRANGGSLGTSTERRYKVRESFKRYWQTDLWHACFDLLLNPGAHAAAEPTGRLPVTQGLRRVREDMERHLAATCERGVGLRTLLGRVVEAFGSSSSRGTLGRQK